MGRWAAFRTLPNRHRRSISAHLFTMPLATIISYMQSISVIVDGRQQVPGCQLMYGPITSIIVPSFLPPGCHSTAFSVLQHTSTMPHCYLYSTAIASPTTSVATTSGDEDNFMCAIVWRMLAASSSHYLVDAPFCCQATASCSAGVVSQNAPGIKWQPRSLR